MCAMAQFHILHTHEKCPPFGCCSNHKSNTAVSDLCVERILEYAQGF